MREPGADDGLTRFISPRTRGAVVIAAQVAIALVVYRSLSRGGLTDRLGSDAAGFRSLVVHPGRAYRDFNTAYPPGALAFFKLLGPANYNAFVRHLIFSNIVAQVLIVWMCFKGWGARAGWSYLVLSIPVMPLLYYHYDLWGVVFALLGMLLLQRRHATGAAVSWVAGAFLKIWPGVLLPGLLAHRKPKSFLVGIGVGVAGLAGWLVWSGTSGPGQVFTYGGSKGWEFESAPGSVLRLITRGALRNEGGALRLGAPPKEVGLLLTLLLVGVIVAVWTHVYRYGAVPGVAEVAVVGASLVFSTLLSAQFVIWVVPFVAIAAASGVTRLERWAGAAAVFTFLYWWTYDPFHSGALSVELFIAARNVAIVGLVVVAIQELRRAPRPASVASGDVEHAL